MPFPLGSFGKSSRDDRARDWSSLTRRQEQRDVYLIKWGRTPSSPWSFHYALLVALQSGGGSPDEKTRGSTIGWGSMENGNSAKRGAKACVRDFNYANEQKMENTYEWLGCTELSDEQISNIMSNYGKTYNIVMNNCQRVTCKVADKVTETWKQEARAQEEAYKKKEGPNGGMYTFFKLQRERREKQEGQNKFGWPPESPRDQGTQAVSRLGMASLGL
ncbi:hypothetical protein N7478_002649 [Penicillium angulare]|uniref:uncharacterized protein n=1 Tax=Penicillium angulare TaxID=116970 RepID=UPI00253FDCAF|nr:uncharacterized protein N7478_002649 [Penicillium angulare]KAJ5286963.1 hypothetical protein N7478_002649 [Penicillium angulare]